MFTMTSSTNETIAVLDETQEAALREGNEGFAAMRVIIDAKCFSMSGHGWLV